jgi:hypothetical protein
MMIDGLSPDDLEVFALTDALTFVTTLATLVLDREKGNYGPILAGNFEKILVALRNANFLSRCWLFFLS